MLYIVRSHSRQETATLARTVAQFGFSSVCKPATLPVGQERNIRALGTERGSTENLALRNKRGPKGRQISKPRHDTPCRLSVLTENTSTRLKPYEDKRSDRRHSWRRRLRCDGEFISWQSIGANESTDTRRKKLSFFRTDQRSGMHPLAFFPPPPISPPSSCPRLCLSAALA